MKNSITGFSYVVDLSAFIEHAHAAIVLDCGARLAHGGRRRRRGRPRAVFRHAPGAGRRRALSRNARACFPRPTFWAAAPAARFATTTSATTRSRRSRCASMRPGCGSPARAGAAPEHSRACGEAIGRALAADDLAGIFVLSDGLNVNGSELVAGITGVVGERIPLTGGLAGDGAQFRGNAGRRRLRPAQAHGRGGRLLRRRRPHRPRQRRRLGRIRAAPPHHPLARQRAVRARRRAGARSLRALSRRGRRARACPAPRCSFPLRIRDPGAARSRRGAHHPRGRPRGALDDVCRRRAGGLGGAADARQFRPAGRRRRRGRAPGPPTGSAAPTPATRSPCW